MSALKYNFVFTPRGRDGNRTVRYYHNLTDKTTDEGRVPDSPSCKLTPSEYRPNVDEPRPQEDLKFGRRLLN